MLEAQLDIPAPPGLARTVYQHTDGNPLFVNELIQVVSEELTRLMSDMSVMELMNCLEEAETAGIIQAHNTLGGYRFAHALIQETLYDEIPLTRRAMLHRKVVSALADRLES